MRPVARVAFVTHGRPEQVGDGVERLVALARRTGVDLVVTPEEAAHHDLAPHGDPTEAELVVVLGGDGTMLRALRLYLGTGVPVLGVNFGRVGFLSSMQPDALEEGLARAFAGEFVTVELPTLELDLEAVSADDEATDVAVNDVVVTSAELGRMVELEWAVGGEDLGRVPCDGIICSTPTGSTAYNLSNGGPVLMWGIDALATTFVAPHSLHARPLVVPRGREVVVWNRTPDVPAAVLVDGHRVGEAGRDGRIAIRLGDTRSLLATLPEATFVRRYRESFAT
ncbi:MAG TPA: NAD(+)/NADH kinase [Gaiella sp.]|nr:NAD(+)/NADH kinase [Gaiella sp.]